MNKEQRKSYLDLINMMPGGYGLCNFCKFAEWGGWSSCEAYLECTHPLDVINGKDNENPYVTWQGGDCWGFRPNTSLQQIGVAVSIFYDGNNAHDSKSKGEFIAIAPSKTDMENGVVKQFV